MSVRRAVPGDETLVRDLRISALADAPDAFHSTLEHERTRTAADWRRWISDGATFLFDTPDGPRGIAAGFPHEGEAAAVLLVSMWVDPSLRGSGVADALAGSVIAWARERGAREVVLDVGEHNERARGFYERLGFLTTGQQFVSEITGVTEVEMRLVLDREPR